MFNRWSSRSPLRSRVLASAMLVLTLMCAACSMQLRTEPNGSETSIAGRWRLHTPQRDTLVASLRTVMEQVRDKQEQRDRRDARRRPLPDIDLSPPDTGRDASTPGEPGHGHRRIAWELREQIEQQEALLNAVLPSDELQIMHSAARIEFLPSVGGRRRFDRGVGSTLVTSYGTFRVESGWQADVFVVHSRDPEQKIDIVERYQRMGEQLRMQVQLNIPDAREQFLTADYLLAKP